jgi:hypothetical protein
VPPSDNGSIQTGSTNFSRFSTSGHNSTGYGKDALNSIQNGASNTTAYGAAAGWSVNTASSCVFVGALSGWGNGLGTITGNDNTCVGNQTALNLTSGARNSLFGSGAGNALTTGSDNIAIGNAVNLAAGTNNTINIGNTIILTTTGPTIRSGSGAATGTQPAGSIWLRTDGTTANRFYVSAGGGTWAAVAGV